MQKLVIALLSAAFVYTWAANAEEPSFRTQRAAMINTIQMHTRSMSKELGKDSISAEVLEAMQQTKRHLFVQKRYRFLAYADRALSIGMGQTISQPFIVALITELANVKSSDTVLEIGTGSGFQAAVLAKLVRKVCTIEIVRSLGEQAVKRLADLGYTNVSVRIGDGYKGWPECGPFDAVIVTAALDHVPQPLIDQLKVGGRLVMPVGAAASFQQLTVVQKLGADKIKTRIITPVAFVPFTQIARIHTVRRCDHA